MAQKLGQCSSAVQNGQMQQAGQMLQDMQADMKSMQQQLQELKLMQEAMAQLEQIRNQMNCQACGGKGCNKCQQPGDGLGDGRGFGERPEDATDTGFYDTRAATKPKPGAGDVVGEVEGPNTKGDVQAKFRQQEQAAKTQPADPLTEQRVPRPYQKHVEEYSNKFRDGR